MYLLFSIQILLAVLVMHQCHAEDGIDNAPNGTDVDIILIVLDDDTDGSSGNATVAPTFNSSTMMPTNTPVMNTTSAGEETTAPVMVSTMATPSPLTPPTASNLVINLEPINNNNSMQETPTFAPFPTIAIPPQAPQTRAPTTNTPSISNHPSSAPTLFPTTGMPTLNTAACALYNQCSNLTGDCCPTVDNVDLACCGVASVEETCERNTRCVDEWGLRGFCCPTLTGVYLDCCDAVPDECQDGNSNCTVQSTREYVQSSAPGISCFMLILASAVVLVVVG